MKIELTNEEIARVFALYYGTTVLVTNDKYINGVASGTLRGVQYDSPLVEYEEGGDEYVNISDCKLMLIPLTQITNIIRLEAVLIFHNERPWLKARISKSKAKKYMPFATNPSYVWDYNVRQYLISNGYAVPLFFGIDHPANGKTAIELGIAIDSTITQPA